MMVLLKCMAGQHFEAISDNQTKITLIIDIPGMDASTDKTFLNSRLASSAQSGNNLLNLKFRGLFFIKENLMPEPIIFIAIKKSSRAKSKSTRSIIKK